MIIAPDKMEEANTIKKTFTKIGPTNMYLCNDIPCSHI